MLLYSYRITILSYGISANLVTFFCWRLTVTTGIYYLKITQQFILTAYHYIGSEH